MLQNENADAAEDLEHFEDITENEENHAMLSPNNTDNKDLVSDTKDGSDNDSDSSLDTSDSDSDSSVDKCGSDTSDSEEDDLTQEDDLLGNMDFYKLEVEEIKSTSEDVVTDIKVQTLPGGYDPRLREPSYW